MKTRMLGKDLNVSSIGLGIMGMDHAYGKSSDRDEMIALIQYSIELGGNFFDTAPIYGQENEILLGKALKSIRNKAIIATKFGIIGQTHSENGIENILDSQPDSIIKQIDNSLKNLNVDCIDLYYQHRIDPNVEPEIVAQVMGELIQAGKIKHWGVSNAPLDYMERAHSITPITATQNQYSMLFREPEKALFDFCEKNSIGFVAYSPLGNGFLSGLFNKQTQYQKGDFRSKMGRFQAEVQESNQPVITLLQEIATDKLATPTQIVLAWELAQRPFIVPIPGTTKQKRLAENLGSVDIELKSNELQAINSKLAAIKIDETYF